MSFKKFAMPVLVIAGALAAVPASATPIVSAVPEPATWAMFLVGFGAIGVMLRKRRRDTVAKANA
jgi:uncharacterized RDD family membrane protein YckC